MPTVKIAKIETVKRGVNSDLFHPFIDPITLRMTIAFSDLLGLTAPVIWKTFQIIELRTNQVFEQWRYQSNIGTSTPGLYSWLDLPTAQGLGLTWTASDIFGFRAAVELFDLQGSSGLVAVDAFAVSDIHWFRLEAVFGL